MIEQNFRVFLISGWFFCFVFSSRRKWRYIISYWTPCPDKSWLWSPAWIWN